MHAAIQENIGLLESCDALLAALPLADYTRPAPVCFNGAIGVHVRHLLDHYLGFFVALQNGMRVDYEARVRDPRIEQEPGYARMLIADVIARLARLDPSGLDERMRARVEVEGDPVVWSESSPARELCFLVSHTVHHCALINVICRANGVPVPADFGVAPSTIRHRAASAAQCAR